MKKLIALVLALVMALALVACSSSTNEAPAGDSSSADSSSDAQTAKSAWPEGTVNCYVPATAGGGTDVMARILTQKLGEATGQSFVVVNDTTGGGTVAAETVRNSDPDGLTLLLTTTAFCAKIATKQYDYTIDDFTIVGVGSTPSIESGVLLVSKDSPYKTFEEFVAYAKENPGEIVSGVQNGGSTMFVQALFNNQVGIETTMVDSGADADKITALMGGGIDCAVTSTQSAAQYVESGDLIALVIAGEERSELIPDAPTLVELGYESVDIPMYCILLGAPGMSEADLDKAESYLESVCADEGIQADYAKLGLAWEFWTREEAAENIHEVQTAYDDAYLILNEMGVA